MEKLNKRTLLTVTALGTMAVIGLAAAIPCFVAPPATRISSRNSCINNLHMINGAKEQWALDGHYTVGAKPRGNEVATFIKGGMPRCPQGGVYHIGLVGENPTCSIESHALSPVTSGLELVPLSTNTPPPNAVLYDPVRRRAIGTVVEIEKYHEFDDGSDRAGILLRDLTGLESWIPRTNLNQSLVIRELLHPIP
jgi:hypothetical protein